MYDDYCDGPASLFLSVLQGDVSRKSSCLNLPLTRRLHKNRLPHNAWLHPPARAQRQVWRSRGRVQHAASSEGHAACATLINKSSGYTSVFLGAIMVVERKRPRAIKDPTNTPLLYISWGQCWITKTCHHETPDLDWFLLPSDIRSNFELPKPPAVNFFCFCQMRKLRGESDQKSCLLPKRWCNGRHDERFTDRQRLHLVYLSASSGRWSSSDRRTTNTEYVNQRESDTKTGDKKDGRLLPWASFL